MSNYNRSNRLILNGFITGKKEDVVFKPSFINRGAKIGIIFTIETESGPLDIWMGEEYFEFEVGDRVFITDSHNNGKLTMLRLIENKSCPVKAL